MRSRKSSKRLSPVCWLETNPAWARRSCAIPRRAIDVCRQRPVDDRPDNPSTRSGDHGRQSKRKPSSSPEACRPLPAPHRPARDALSFDTPRRRHQPESPLRLHRWHSWGVPHPWVVHAPLGRHRPPRSTTRSAGCGRPSRLRAQRAAQWSRVGRLVTLSVVVRSCPAVPSCPFMTTTTDCHPHPPQKPGRLHEAAAVTGEQHPRSPGGRAGLVRERGCCDLVGAGGVARGGRHRHLPRPADGRAVTLGCTLRDPLVGAKRRWRSAPRPCALCGLTCRSAANAVVHRRGR